MFEHAGHHGGPSTLAWVIFALLLALLLLSLVSMALDAYYRSQPPRGGHALAALDARYAAGEVPREEYLQTRRDLGGAVAADAPTEEIKPAPKPPA